MNLANLTRDQHLLISKIADRAINDVFQPQGVAVQKLDVMMDLEATYAVCPLDLEKLNDFDRGNFGHDIAGIYRHLNRETGELMDCFLPRCYQR